jgi:hypothetical protein
MYRQHRIILEKKATAEHRESIYVGYCYFDTKKFWKAEFNPLTFFKH